MRTAFPVGSAVLAFTPTVVGLDADQGRRGLGPGFTVTTAVPLRPSLVAMTVVVPAAIAWTKPEPAIVAFVESLKDHVTARPKSALPVESHSVVLKRVVSPTTILTLPGVTVTVWTGTGVAVTEIWAVSAGTPMAVVTTSR